MYNLETFLSFCLTNCYIITKKSVNMLDVLESKYKWEAEGA